MLHHIVLKCTKQRTDVFLAVLQSLTSGCSAAHLTRKIRQKPGFLCLAFPRIRTEKKILFSYGKIQTGENQDFTHCPCINDFQLIYFWFWTYLLPKLLLIYFWKKFTSVRIIVHFLYRPTLLNAVLFLLFLSSTR